MSKPSPPLTQQERLAIHHRRFQKMGQPAAAPPPPPAQDEKNGGRSKGSQTLRSAQVTERLRARE